MNAQLEINQVAMAYGGKPVVNDISFQLEAGAIGCLLGPSGCGKTSLLRAIAGFEPVTAGSIRLDGGLVSAPGITVPPEQRRVGMVFQDFALYPHLTVAKNVGFGLRAWSKADREGRVKSLLELVGLASEAERYPHQLSGGQQQRVALIRAMAPRPNILLLDEPFSNMDVELREQLAHEVRSILKRDGITAILVTHDQMEAFAMADHIGVLGEGRLHQWASGYELYHQPADRFVADFIGRGVMLKGRVQADGSVQTALGVIRDADNKPAATGEIEFLLRPDDIVHDDASPLKLEVVSRAFRGAEYLYTLGLADGSRVLCMVQSHHDHAIGEKIGVRLVVDHLVILPAAGGPAAPV
jgi:iron(III) transport system ATP-binding protein